MAYIQNRPENFDHELFQNPTSEYRGAPFWAWNTRLDGEQLKRQIEYFKEMGFGSFYMHSRIGLDTEYLGEEFLEMVRQCIAKAREEQLLAGLYDEDLWPSGCASGLVTEQFPQFRRKSLLFTCKRRDGAKEKEDFQAGDDICHIGTYDISLDGDGCLAGVTFSKEHKCEAENRRFAYVVAERKGSDYSKAPQLDVMNPAAVETFIDITHERYKEKVGAEFGGVVRTIFTDEPNFESIFHQNLALATPWDEGDVSVPWTMDLPETFREEFGADILPKLPELFYEFPKGQISQLRYLFRRHLADRFQQAFFKTIYHWCEENRIAFTGHVLFEDSLGLQSRSVGDAMKLYRYFHIPGIDVLFDDILLVAVKQAQSVVHQYGREGMMSELYGVTNWDFDFRGHKFQGDWQAALGVTHRVPHLAWLSMEGISKRDYPASIHYQSPWYQEYRYMEDHFARLNTVLTRGKPLVTIGMIHPIESFWTLLGCDGQTKESREETDRRFTALSEYLLKAQLDFDYISEGLLEELTGKFDDVSGGLPAEQAGKAGTKIGEMEYAVILVPGCIVLRPSTVRYLERFSCAGGSVIFAGACPYCFESTGNVKLQSLYENSVRVPYEPENIKKALERERMVEITNASHRAMIYQLRQDGEERWFFGAYAERDQSGGAEPDPTRIRFKGAYFPTLYRTLTGEEAEVKFEIQGDATVVYLDLYSHDSVLLRLRDNQGKNDWKTAEKSSRRERETDRKQDIYYPRLTEIFCQEPNVLLLDMAEYSFDGVRYMPKANVLKADDLFRQKIGYPVRSNYDRKQPWQWPGKNSGENLLYLRYRIQSAIEKDHVFLALENVENTGVRFNGTAIEKETAGWYIDEKIQKIKLPKLLKGTNTLELCISIENTNIRGAEDCYLLGDFGVAECETGYQIEDKCRTFDFVSVTEQKMPFYGGNVIYRTEQYLPKGTLKIRVKDYKGPLIRVYVDGVDCGIICLSPYTLDVGEIEQGLHEITFKLYGNRYNTLAPLHYADTSKTGALPAMWNPTGELMTEKYLIKDFGILRAPELIVEV